MRPPVVPPVPSRRALLRVIVVAASLVAAGCSDSPAAIPTTTIMTTADRAPAGDVTALEVRLAAVYGEGRALMARPTSAGTAIATTAGVVMLGEDGPTTIDTFEVPAQPLGIAVSPDGRQFAVATDTPPAIQWYDADQGRRIGTALLPGPSAAQHVAIGLGTGQTAFASTTDAVYRWGDPRSALDSPRPGLVAAGRPVALPDGDFVVAAAGADELVFLGDGAPVAVPVTGGSPRDLAVSGDGSTLAVTVSAGGESDLDVADTVVVLDASAREPIATLPMDGRLQPDLWAVTDADVIVSTDGAVVVHPIDGGAPSTLSPVIDDPVTRVLATSDEVLTVGRRGSITMWTTATGVGTVVSDDGVTMNDVYVDEASGLLTATDFYGRVRVWSLADGELVVDHTDLAVGVATSVAVAPGGDGFAVASTAGTVTLLDGDFGTSSTVAVTTTPSRVDTVEYVPWSGALVTGLAERVGDEAFDDTVTIWQDGDPEFSVGGEAEEVGGCAFFYNRIRFSPTSDAIALTSHDFSVSTIDPATGATLREFRPEAGAILDTAFTADGTHLVVSSDASTVTIWNTGDGALTTQYPAPMGGYQALALLPGDLSHMAGLDITGTISIVDVMTGEIVSTLDGTAARSTSLAVSGDGALLAAPSIWGGFTVWSTTTGAALVETPAHHGLVTDLAFSGDGATLVTVSTDGSARRWDLART